MFCLFFSAARSASVPPERLHAVRKLAASLQCPLLFAENQVCSDSTLEQPIESIKPSRNNHRSKLKQLKGLFLLGKDEFNWSLRSFVQYFYNLF